MARSEQRLEERQVGEFDAWPTRWRGALVVSVLEAKPLAVAHVPGSTMIPFAMAVAFLLIFAGALIEDLLLFGAGGILAVLMLVAWYWPQRSETAALEELGARSETPGGLPFAIGGPIANGYWGMLVFIGVLATALITTVASYFYMVEVRPQSAAMLRSDLPAWVSALLPLAVVAATAWGLRGVRQSRPGAWGLALGAALVLSAVALWLSVAGFPWSTLQPGRSGYASSLVGLLGFQWIVLLVLLVNLGIALLWAVLRPLDPRGHTVAHNAHLMASFAAASSVVVFGVAYLSPWLT